MFRRAAVLTGVGILVSALVMGTTVYGAQNLDDKITIRMLLTGEIQTLMFLPDI